MKRVDRKLLRGCTAAAVILVAVLAWPSAGWSKKMTVQVCEVKDVPRLLANWGSALAQSTPDNVGPIVATYDPIYGVLVPTCANGPNIGLKMIAGYFHGFLESKPTVTFGNPTIGGNCTIAFASGLYTFKMSGNRELKARYTYVFEHGRIMQHHSSLQPVDPGGECAPH